MTTHTGISRLTPDEIDQLLDSRNRRLRDDVVRCVSLLHDLVTRYTGSMSLVAIPDEGVARRLLDERLERLRGVEPYGRMMTRNVATYRSVKELFEQQGASPAVVELSQAVTDDLVDLWTSITRAPRLGHTNVDPEEPEQRLAG